DRFVGQDKGIEAAQAPGADAAGGWVEAEADIALDAVGEEVFEVGAIEGRGAANAGGGGGAGDLGDDEEGFAGEGIGFLERRLPAIGEAETAAAAGLLRDAVGKGAGEMAARRPRFACVAT